jgi:hypothetical protein
LSDGVLAATDSEAESWVEVLRSMLPEGAEAGDVSSDSSSDEEDSGKGTKQKKKTKGKKGKKSIPYPPDREDTIWCSVSVRAAKGLMAKDITGTSDPYITITVQEPESVDKKVGHLRLIPPFAIFLAISFQEHLFVLAVCYSG